MNSWATPTCVTDGERVYAFFGDGGGLYCYSADGEQLWTKDLGRFDEGGWGTAASPILYKNLVIQNCDSDNNAYLIALDKVSGEQVWKTDREDYRGWSTPLVIDVEGHKELVLNGHTGVRAYDPDTGKELWFCAAGNGRGEATMTPGPDGLLYAVAGRPGKENNVDILAVRAGGKGDVTATHKAWDASRRGGRDLPSPIVMGEQVLVSNMVGILTCYDARTGEEDWKVRLGGNYSASPVAWAGVAFFLGEDGRTVVVKPGEKFEAVAENLLTPDDDEIFRASITPSDGQIFIRSTTKLYCIGQRKSAAK
jgi:outer membrane protein assembly factor BamB